MWLRFDGYAAEVSIVCSREDGHARRLSDQTFQQIQTRLGKFCLKKPSQCKAWPLASAGEEGFGVTVGLIQGSARVLLPCYGWIDGQKKPEGEQTWLQRFVSAFEQENVVED